MNELSKTHTLAAKVTFAALQVLKDNGGEMRGRDVIQEVGNRVDLDEWEKGAFEKSGHIRWSMVLKFSSVGSIKAGFLVKKRGIWFLTPEGEKALELGPVGMFQEAERKYQEWNASRMDAETTTTDNLGASETEIDGPKRAIVYEEIEQLALDAITDAINSKNPYEFQDLVAALLRAMGYYTPFVAPRGKDGGVDVIAYRDPLGTQTPRLKIQIKHRESTTAVQEVRQLMGLLQKDGDVGIFVSTGGFTSDAKTTARGSHVHVELIDLVRFIDLWRQFYDKLADEDKALLPLVPIYMVPPNQ